MSYPAGTLAGMKFFRLVQERFDSASLPPRLVPLPPPWSLRVIEGQTGIPKRSVVRFSVKIGTRRS